METAGGDTGDGSGDGGAGDSSGGDSENSSIDFSSGGVFSWIAQGFENVVNAIGSFLNYLNPTSEKFILKDVINGLVAIGEWFVELLDYLNPMSEKFILKSIIGFFVELISYINPLDENFIGYKLIELLGDLLEFLFIPSEDAFEPLYAVWNEKFLFIDTIKVTIDSIKNSILNSLPGELGLTFSVDTPIYEGDLEINFGWFEKFKPYTDLLLTGFIYLAFVWRLFANLPNIIAGISINNGGASGHDN